MVLKFEFQGLIAPVFTPFYENGEVNLNEIKKYANYLTSSNNVDGVLVNGTVGEGMSMNVEERKKVAKAWVDALQNTNLKIMVQISGTNLKDVLSLAKHAENLNVSSILCLPELFYQLSSANDLVEYLALVGDAAPNTPLFYYHIPSFTKVNFDMELVLDMAYEKVPTMAGIKFTHFNLDEGFRCLNVRQGAFKIFLGYDMIFAGAIVMGFDSAIIASANFYSKNLKKIQRNLQTGSVKEAMDIQRQLNELISVSTKQTTFVAAFKEITSQVIGINLGNPRLPLKPLSDIQKENIKTALSNSSLL